MMVSPQTDSSANNTENNEWDDATIIIDNRSGVTSRVTSEGDPTDFRLEDTRVTSDGGHEQNVEEQSEPARRRNKVREK